MTYLKKKNSIPLILLCILSSITVFAPVPDSASFRDVIIVFIPIILYCILQKKCLVKSLYIYILLSFEAILASAFSIYAEFERTVLTYFLFALLTVLFASIKFSRFQLHSFIKYYKFLSILCSSLIILSWFYGVEHGWNRYSIGIIGIERNPNYINAVLLLAIAFILHEFICSPKNKVILVGEIFYLMFACALTGTRAAVLTACIAVVFAFLYRIVKDLKFYYLIVGGMLVLLIGIIVINYVPEEISARFMGEDSFEDKTRMIMWTSNFIPFMDHWFWGMGIGATTIYTSHLGLKVDNMHNVMLQFLYEQGVVGLVLFFLIIKSILKRIDKMDVLLFLLMFITLYIPICFQNGLVGLTFWWPLIILEIFSRTSTKESLSIYET